MLAENMLLDMPLPLKLPPLQFDPTALAPTISEETLKYHHGKHHKGYIDKTNKLVTELEVQQSTLEAVIKDCVDIPKKEELLNNALQVWNHTFQWLSLSPISDLKIAPRCQKLVEATFGGIDGLATRATEVGTAHFGSGWLWLIGSVDGLELITTHDAERPEDFDMAILVIDLWEHAYYLDHKNKRGDYIKSVVQNLWNWKFAESRLR